MAGVLWSDKEKEILTKMVGSGCTMQEVMTVFRGRSKDSIWDKMNSMGLHINRESELDLNAYERIMAGRGMTEQIETY